MPRLLLLPLLLLAASFTRAQSLVDDATRLQEHVNASNTDYRHKDNAVTWTAPWECYADCSGFVNALIGHVYHLDDAAFQQTFGHRRMYAYHYFEAIRDGRHFQQIRNAGDIRPGDLIAVQYADRSEHDDNTGHVMLVVSTPERFHPVKVIEPNTRQYLVTVIDCSRSPHGKDDTRAGGGPSGQGGGAGDYPGLGRGPLRLYTDLQGAVVGYSWSPGNPKEGFDPFENPIVIGRLTL